MARIRSTPPSGTQAFREDFVEAIVKALKGEDQADQPVIFEVATGGTDYFQVIVIWERWADISSDIRNRIVTEAYQRFSSESSDGVSTERISMILPVTADQAIEMGILPYSVMSSVHRRAAGYEQIEKLMKEEGAIETTSGTELRLPTLEMAQAARNRLQDATRATDPEVHWQISQQVGRIVDY